MPYFKTCNEGTSNTPQTWHDSSPSCIHDLTSPWSQMHSIGSSGSAPNRPDFPIFDGDNSNLLKYSDSSHISNQHCLKANIGTREFIDRLSLQFRTSLFRICICLVSQQLQRKSIPQSRDNPPGQRYFQSGQGSSVHERNETNSIDSIGSSPPRSVPIQIPSFDKASSFAFCDHSREDYDSDYLMSSPNIMKPLKRKGRPSIRCGFLRIIVWFRIQVPLPLLFFIQQGYGLK